jgi:hypothetical protein
MRTHSLPARFAWATTLTLTSLIITLQDLAPSQAQTAAPSDICYSPGFGFDGSFTKTADFKFCAGAPDTRTTQNELFWVPTKLGKTCLPTGNRSASITNRAIRIINLYNLDSRRRLTVTGTGQGDVLVGSPVTSDTLIGGGGRDTYVVGGIEATLVVVSPDKLFPVSTVAELDKIKLGASTEYIYINPGTAGQSNPGSLTTPIPGARPGAFLSFTPKGASAVASLVPSDGDCRAFLPGPSLIASLPWPQQTFLPGAAASASDGVAPLLVSQATAPNPTGDESGGNTNLRQPQDSGDGFPGSPTLIGFSLKPARADRLFLPAKGFTFLGKPINDYLRGSKSIKVVVVDRMTFAPAEVVSRERLNRLLTESQGLSRLRSNQAPLFYFRQNGLLVFSQNGEPLGSRANPGRIIAQLLDPQGQPLRLPIAPDQRFYEAKFLEFRPAQ